MVAQPTGTVTLLFTDVEGSTQLLGRLGTDRYSDVLELHRRLLREAFERQGGFEVGTEGDSFFVSFQRAERAVTAAGEAQQALATAVWPDGEQLRVRMGVHTGDPAASGGHYVGMDVHQAARIMSAGHGGQVLVSEATVGLLDGVALRDLGPHRLKDLLAPIRLYQLELDGLPGEFPPLRSLHQTNLPVAAWPLLGREHDLDKIRALVAAGVKLVTLTGPGGSGKTRLGLQAAAELAEEFVDGVFFVALAPLRDAVAVRSTVAEAVGLQPDADVAGWLAVRRTLLLLDNLEHLAGVDAAVTELLVGDTTILATSRTPLRLSGEHELPVEPLADDAAVELFVSRAAAAGRPLEVDETVAAVCRRLDNLPLALELAAARAKLLSPVMLLERLDHALPLLTGGASDRPERQRTLRATISWSYDLLDPDAQSAFRRLSVFRGSFMLDSAEAVAGASLDDVAALVDQSLVRPLGEERFFLLETLREYARERLNDLGESGEYRMKHARFYLARLKQDEPDLWGPRRSEVLAWGNVEEDNLRAMLDELTAEAVEDAPEAVRLLHRYWGASGAYTEERPRIEALLSHDGLSDKDRGLLFGLLADIEMFVGSLDALEIAAHESLRLLEVGSEDHALTLMRLATAAARRGHYDDAVRYGRQVLDEAESLSSERRNWLRMDIAIVFADAGLFEEARALTREVRDEFRLRGNELDATAASANLAQFDLSEHDYESALTGLTTALQDGRRLDHYLLLAEILRDLGYALLGLNRKVEARTVFAELLDLATEDSSTASAQLFAGLAGIALTADAAEPAAARLRGALDALRETTGITNDPRNEQLDRHFEQHLIDSFDPKVWTHEHMAGTSLTLEEAIALARSIAGTASGTTTALT